MKPPIKAEPIPCTATEENPTGAYRLKDADGAFIGRILSRFDAENICDAVNKEADRIAACQTPASGFPPDWLEQKQHPMI